MMQNGCSGPGITCSNNISRPVDSGLLPPPVPFWREGGKALEAHDQPSLCIPLARITHGLTPGLVARLLGAAIIKQRSLWVILNNRDMFSHNSRGYKSKSKVLRWFSDASSPLAWDGHLLLSPYLLFSLCMFVSQPTFFSLWILKTFILYWRYSWWTMLW